MGTGESSWNVGDLVWVHVQGYPWWPGQVMNEKFASKQVKRGRKGDDSVLVSFFGDSSYGWFSSDLLIDFEEHYDVKSQQTGGKVKKSFKAAREEGKELLDIRKGMQPTTERKPIDFLSEEAEKELEQARIEADLEDDDDEDDEGPVRQIGVPERIDVEGTTSECVMGWRWNLAVSPLEILADECESAGLVSAEKQLMSLIRSSRENLAVETILRGRRRRTSLSKQKTKATPKKTQVDDEDNEYVPDGAGGGEDNPTDVNDGVNQTPRKSKIKQERRRTSRQPTKRAGVSKTPAQNGSSLKSKLPRQKIGKKYKAVKKGRKRGQRIHEVELPDPEVDVELKCALADVSVWTRSLGQDPLCNDDELTVENAQLALLRFREKTFNRPKGGRRKGANSKTPIQKPRKSAKKRVSTEQTPVDDMEVDAITPGSVAGKSDLGTPTGAGGSAKKTPGNARKGKEGRASLLESIPEKKKGNEAAGSQKRKRYQAMGSYEVENSARKSRRPERTEALRGQKVVLHIQFPKDCEMPSGTQVHLYGRRFYSKLLPDKVLIGKRDHKATIIYTFEEDAKQASIAFKEKAHRYFHFEKGSIDTALAGYVPGGTRNAAKNQEVETNRGGVPSANIILPKAKEEEEKKELGPVKQEVQGGGVGVGVGVGVNPNAQIVYPILGNQFSVQQAGFGPARGFTSPPMESQFHVQPATQQIHAIVGAPSLQFQQQAVAVNPHDPQIAFQGQISPVNVNVRNPNRSGVQMGNGDRGKDH